MDVAKHRIGAIGLLLLAQAVGTGPAVSAEDAFSDAFAEQEALRAQIAAVNEGALAFLDTPPKRVVHHHAGRISISPQSLDDGWVVLEQCHVNLDRVSAAQILFNPTRSRNLSVVSTRNIDDAYPEGSSIQLRGIGVDSEICLRAESRALHRVDDGVYELKNGPFMRRFLDGYYPLRLSLTIDYPDSLSLADHQPLTQPGFAVVQQPGTLNVEALFEGELRTAFRFLRD
ncbi:MAG: hypothetical protein QNJ91_09040 [Gammaproteobacteria bacterium]|nr:hypothetical protein [Gammaproteobacteria bacterium]